MCLLKETYQLYDQYSRMGTTGSEQLVQVVEQASDAAVVPGSKTAEETFVRNYSLSDVVYFLDCNWLPLTLIIPIISQYRTVSDFCNVQYIYLQNDLCKVFLGIRILKLLNAKINSYFHAFCTFIMLNNHK